MAPGSREEHLRVGRTARYHVLGDPSTSRETWVVLHGYAQLAERFVRRFEALPGLDRGRRAVVAPEALSRFYVDGGSGPHGAESRVGATWMTRADREHEIADYVEYLDAVAAGAVAGGEPRLVVLGFSQGSETASRWCAYGRTRPAELILWGGGLAADLDLDRAARALADCAVTFVAGDRDDRARRRSAAGRAALAEAGVACRVEEYAGGHAIEPAVLSALWP